MKQTFIKLQLGASLYRIMMEQLITLGYAQDEEEAKTLWTNVSHPYWWDGEKEPDIRPLCYAYLNLLNQNQNPEDYQYKHREIILQKKKRSPARHYARRHVIDIEYDGKKLLSIPVEDDFFHNAESKKLIKYEFYFSYMKNHRGTEFSETAYEKFMQTFQKHQTKLHKKLVKIHQKTPLPRTPLNLHPETQPIERE